MALIQSLIGVDKYNLKCPYTMSPKGICVHNTANNASAENEISYMKNNNDSTSYHIAIDDIQAIQGLPFNRNAWASGDGINGEGNRNYIHLEICYSLSGGTRFINAEKRASKEIAELLKKYGWTIKNVKKHQDFSNKYCPHRTLDLGWQRFLNMIQVEMDKLSSPLITTKPVQSNGEIKEREYKEKGKFTCLVDSIFFRNKPIISNDNPTKGSYKKNESVNYDYVVITNKYTYISWISSATGERRYMPITDRFKNEKWGYCV